MMQAPVKWNKLFKQNFLLQFLSSLKPCFICFGGGGGSRKFRKFEKNKVQKENCPKSVEDQKKRSSLKFSPNFCPKLGEDQKKRSSPKFSPIFAQTWVQANNKGLRLPFVCSNLLPNLHFAY